MKRRIIVSLIVLVVGFAMMGVGFAYGGIRPLGLGWNGPAFGLVQNTNNMVRVDQTWKNASGITSLRVDLAMINRVEIRAEGDSFSVKGQNWELAGGLQAKLAGGTLTVESGESKNHVLWPGILGFIPPLRADECSVVVTVPAGVTLDTVNAETGIGQLHVTGIDAKTLVLNSSTGNTTLQDVSADSFKMTSSVGNCTLDNVRAQTSNFSIDTGNFTANSFTSTKGLTFKKSLGNAVFTDAVLNGDSRFDKSTGNLTLSLRMPRESVGYEINSSTGNVRIDGAKVQGDASNTPPGAENHLSVTSSLGNVTIDFTS